MKALDDPGSEAQPLAHPRGLVRGERQSRFSVRAENRGVVVTEAGSYLRRTDSCITQLQAQGPSRTCNESKEEEEEDQIDKSPEADRRVRGRAHDKSGILVA